MNSLGQRTSITKNGLAYPAATVETVGYDSKGQVVKTTDNTTAANNRLYTFDAIGNRLTDNLNTYTVNSVNEIQSILKNSDNSVINTTHDDDGNMLSGTLPEDANGATLVWDAQNRLTKITKSDNTIIEYSYDYQSRRISKTVGTTKTTWIYNAWNPIAEYSNTTLTKTLTWGQDINGGIQSAGGVGGLLQETHHYPPLDSHYYPLYDGKGNITDYINTASAVLAHYQYDAFGNTIVKTGFKADDFTHRFSTKQLGAETGLYYYGYRYYDPVTGRWPSRDPIEENGGVNLYIFVGNDPIGRWDQLGLRPFGAYMAEEMARRGYDWSYLAGNGWTGEIAFPVPFGPVGAFCDFFASATVHRCEEGKSTLTVDISFGASCALKKVISRVVRRLPSQRLRRFVNNKIPDLLSISLFGEVNGEMSKNLSIDFELAGIHSALIFGDSGKGGISGKGGAHGRIPSGIYLEGDFSWNLNDGSYAGGDVVTGINATIGYGYFSFHATGEISLLELFGIK